MQTQTTKKNNKHVWGLWLSFVGGFLCINPYFLIFALPVTLVGITLLWFSALDVKSKIGCSLLPWLLPVAFYAMLIFR